MAMHMMQARCCSLVGGVGKKFIPTGVSRLTNTTTTATTPFQNLVNKPYYYLLTT
jgi:hypothetical protein